MVTVKLKTTIPNEIVIPSDRNLDVSNDLIFEAFLPPGEVKLQMITKLVHALIESSERCEPIHKSSTII